MAKPPLIDVADGVLVPLRDASVTLGADKFPRVEPEVADRLLPGNGPSPDAPNAAVNGFLFQSDGQNALIDAGGLGLLPDAGGIGRSLAQLGVRPDEIDTIILTHIHPDHIGGLMADGAAVYLNATLRLSEDELGFWTNPDLRGKLPPPVQPFFDFAQAAVAGYRDRIATFNGEAELIPGVTTVPLPGHTPGHTGYQIGEGDDGILIWGDIVHVAGLQFAVPEASIIFDVDPDTAIATRKDIMSRVSLTGQRIAGMHLFSTGRVERAGDGFAFIPDA